ncbi:coenzyme F420-0:L-glutamate ligase [Afifella pfennigii]|uniref:coenzyme F420-0:L-glutamate ligase n=1 Tax=Afifella pfennigii TaxID=209897 RepID=UPI00047B9BEF|nr:coenzyme F420-0:L-glutamate ligase [Afifella pfennigii]
MASGPLTLIALQTLPSVTVDTDLCGEILAAAEREGEKLRDGDILVVAQKVVSKAEGRLVALSSLTPSPRALALAEETGKEPELMEAILSETKTVLRTRPGLVVVEHRLGHIMANAGIDRSNTGCGEDWVLLLPKDPDASARALRREIGARAGARIGVIVSDSFGRPWRFGTTGVAIGVAGPAMRLDRRGEPDRDGRALEVTEIGLADSLAAAAVLAMGEGAESRPVVIARGLEWMESGQKAADGLRPASEDLFR